MLDRDIVDNLWQKGYCKALIEQVKHSPPGPAGAADRIALLEAHIGGGCVDCHYANVIKDVEMRTATAMGPEAVAVWQRGGDIRPLPGFQEHFKRVFETGVAIGRLDQKVMTWLSRMVPERAGQPYPYYEEDHAKEAN